MKTKHILLFLLVFGSFYQIFGQTARIKGVILDEYKLPVRDVTITASSKKTISDVS